MTFTDIEEYSMRSIAILGCNIYSQITVAHVTLPKAVLNTVAIFAVWLLFMMFGNKKSVYFYMLFIALAQPVCLLGF